MRQRLTIILTFIVIIGLLVILNSLSHVTEEKGEDYEVMPNRSTYHSGPTGTRALHDFLKESGYKVIRWREATDRLLSDSGGLVKTFVVIGRTRVPFTDEEAQFLRQWISRGGRFVLIDREINTQLMPNSEGWSLVSRQYGVPDITINPADSNQMTENVTALEPVQPTPFTARIQKVMPSRFASRLVVLSPTEGGMEDYDSLEDVDEIPSTSASPVVHIADRHGALLVDYRYGLGSIVLLTDPYVVANGGIKLDDNLQLAINSIAGRDDLIAFDEFHQGKAISQNAFASYFAGTPVLALAAQLLLLVLLILWTNARRFGRPLPLPHVDRRSSLEFVASMAELQERSRAFDLAIENIYTRTRRVLARYAGLDYNSPSSEIARRIAERSTIDGQKLETLMRQSEEAINGGPISWRQAIILVQRLRAVEKDLGLGMRSRDVRQAAENI
jgi:Domain of unknown function (DUF4350)